VVERKNRMVRSVRWYKFQEMEAKDGVVIDKDE